MSWHDVTKHCQRMRQERNCECRGCEMKSHKSHKNPQKPQKRKPSTLKNKKLSLKKNETKSFKNGLPSKPSHIWATPALCRSSLFQFILRAAPGISFYHFEGTVREWPAEGKTKTKTPRLAVAPITATALAEAVAWGLRIRQNNPTTRHNAEKPKPHHTHMLCL